MSASRIPPDHETVNHLAGFDRIVLIDAVAAQAPAGTVLRYSREDILRHPPGLRLSPHDPALKETLMMLDLIGQGPGDIVLVGVVAKLTGMGIGLSDEVRAALPSAIDGVIAELERFGVLAVPRHTPRAADLWWAAAAHDVRHFLSVS